MKRSGLDVALALGEERVAGGGGALPALEPVDEALGICIRALAARGRGRRFWKCVVSEWKCSPAELELLAEACRTLDELDVLRRAVAKEGATVVGSQGQPRAHPALAELRQGRAELRRMLAALGFPAEAPEDGAVLSLTAPARRGLS